MPETTEGQRAQEAEASEPVAEDAELPGSITQVITPGPDPGFTFFLDCFSPAEALRLTLDNSPA